MTSPTQIKETSRSKSKKSLVSVSFTIKDDCTVDYGKLPIDIVDCKNNAQRRQYHLRILAMGSLMPEDDTGHAFFPFLRQEDVKSLTISCDVKHFEERFPYALSEGCFRNALLADKDQFVEAFEQQIATRGNLNFSPVVFDFQTSFNAQFDKHEVDDVISSNDAAVQSEEPITDKQRHGRDTTMDKEASEKPKPQGMAKEDWNQAIVAVRHLMHLPGEFRAAVLGTTGLHNLTVLEDSTKEARTALYHTEVFGAQNAKPTLAKAKKWLNEMRKRDLTSDQKRIVVRSIQWLRETLRIKPVFPNSEGIPEECLVDTPFHPKKKDVRLIRLRRPGERNGAITKPENIPADLNLSR